MRPRGSPTNRPVAGFPGWAVRLRRRDQRGQGGGVRPFSLRTEPRTEPDRIAAFGYGTGGAVGLELGRGGVNLRAIGTFNALATGQPGEAARIRCPVWAGVGPEDPIMPPAQWNAFTAEMQAAGVDWRLTVYGGALHAFHHPPVGHPTVGYHRQHAQRAWRDVVDLLAECLPVTEALGT